MVDLFKFICLMMNILVLVFLFLFWFELEIVFLNFVWKSFIFFYVYYMFLWVYSIILRLEEGIRFFRIESDFELVDVGVGNLGFL